MHFTSEQRLDEATLEREFTLGEIPGILWTPTSAPALLILLGHPADWARCTHGWRGEPAFRGERLRHGHHRAPRER